MLYQNEDRYFYIIKCKPPLEFAETAKIPQLVDGARGRTQENISFRYASSPLIF